MPAVILLIVLIVVTVLLVKAIVDARQDFPTPARGTLRRTPPPRPARRPRRPIDEQRLAQHAAKLREAVGHELITHDEAVASILRHTDGRLSEHAAQELLREGGR